LSDVIATLQGIAPHDWAKFFQDRVYTTTPHAPTGGITGGGWKMAWTDSLGPLQSANETADKKVVESYSLGLELAEDGKVRDVVPGSPADLAGVAPDMKLIAVNGRRYEKDVLRDAIAASRASGSVELLCENKLFFRTFKLSYKEGRRHPVLVRDSAQPADHVSAILAAHVH
jgi:predicted metalloprotease with PDZ domain